MHNRTLKESSASHLIKTRRRANADGFVLSKFGLSHSETPCKMFIISLTLKHFSSVIIYFRFGEKHAAGWALPNWHV